MGFPVSDSGEAIKIETWRPKEQLIMEVLPLLVSESRAAAG